MMDRLKNATILTTLTDGLRAHNSWCGETHLQKSTYLLQELCNVPMGYDFILYKHGPFSFELRDEIACLRADGFLELEPQSPPYGPRFASTEQSMHLQEWFSQTYNEHKVKIDFVVDFLGDRGVEDLESLATAFYVCQEGIPQENRIGGLTKLKPHIAEAKAKIAFKEIDQIMEDVRSLTT